MKQLPPREERGSALVLSLFVLLLLSSMGVALTFLSVTEMQMSQGNLRTKKAFFLAEAGEEDARATLFAINGIDPFSDDLATHAGADGVIDFDPDALQLTYDADGNVTGLTGFDDDVPLRGLTGFGEGWYAAFLNNDPAEGRSTVVDANNRVMITGVGAGSDRSLEMVQVVVEKREVLPSVPPATITLLGAPPPEFHGGNADVHDYSGDDCAGGPNGVPGLYVPIVGTVGQTAETAAETGWCCTEDATTGEDGPDYDSGPYEDLDTFADLTDPTEPTVAGSGYGALDPAWNDCDAVVQMIEDIREAADVVCCTPPSCATPVPDPCVLPASAPGRVVFIDGDWDIGPGDSGAGTLLVTGELRYNGKASWNGMLFAFGQGRYQRYGAGNGHVSGAIMVADVAGPDDLYGTADDCSNGFESAYADLAGGGNADTHYCTADILAARPKPPYKILSFRQD